ncbi:MAG: hypothetical protein JRJ87_09670 [Deltaproteobacteria bacterium]|nr:hypothetical protein [Deltaproteobacteria bacterium]
MIGNLSKLISLSFFVGAALLGCNGESSTTDAGSDGRYPDPAFIYEASGHQQTVSDESFLQERPTLFRTSDVLADLDARALAIIGADVYVGTASGLFLYDAVQNSFVKESLASGEVAVADISATALADNRLAIALATTVELFDPGGVNSQTVDIQTSVSSIAADGAVAWVGTDQGLYKVESGAASQVPEVPQAAIHDVCVDSSGNIWLATSSGLAKFDKTTTEIFDAASGKLPDDDVRAVFCLATGGVVTGCASGAAIVGSASDRILSSGFEALPYDDITSVWASADLLAFGHTIGATVVKGNFEHIDYYHSLRWIPDESVTAVALAADGTRWIATKSGVVKISLESNSLAEKAAMFDSLNEGFWRLDFVSCDGWRAEAWDTSAPINHHDHDNDGLWTQIQIVAWSYAAAATGDDSYCELARRAMRGMMMQIDIPAVSFEAAGKKRGFVARSFVRDDEENVFTSKVPQDNWHLVENYDGHDYYWKDDTSSDETDGHFFGYPVFFDFCAKDDAEREELAEHAGALARYIMENDFKLIDLDWQRTEHGHWGLDTEPIALDGFSKCTEVYSVDNCVDAAFGGGWLNGMQILGHMLAAYHMTGDVEFYEAYEFLLENRYAELVDFDENVWTVTKPGTANHSDHELAMLAYHTLIRYEANDERRQRWIESLLAMYAYEVPERNPCWSAIVAGFVDDGYYLDEAIETLQIWPEDWREWLVDNNHRKDVFFDVIDRAGNKQFTRVLPYDEIRTMKWNGNPYVASNGGDGRSVQAPWPWLLPYWMYRYHGVIQ